VFSVNTDGTGFSTLHSFAGGSDGAKPLAGLILSGNTLYGTAWQGGSSGNGTVFSVNIDGSGFMTIYSFSAGSGVFPSITNSDGAYPYGGLVLCGNTLFGTASSGGTWGDGTVFSISLPPQLTLIASGPNVILTWPTNATGFTLQSTTYVGSSAVWATNFPEPVVVNGQNTVTNPISGAQQFYRLSQ
jgi:uncharacterized repeat protein (TIGR03803 family)